MRYFSEDLNTVLLTDSTDGAEMVNNLVTRGFWQWDHANLDEEEASGNIKPYVPLHKYPNKHNSKRVRDEHINSTIEVLGDEWQVDEGSRGFMSDSIEYMNSHNVTVNWILNNNKTREVTANELTQVLDAYRVRLSSTFAKYAEWDHTGLFDPTV